MTGLSNEKEIRSIVLVSPYKMLIYFLVQTLKVVLKAHNLIFALHILAKFVNPMMQRICGPLNAKISLIRNYTFFSIFKFELINSLTPLCCSNSQSAKQKIPAIKFPGSALFISTSPLDWCVICFVLPENGYP
jgi:hypothetical protein